MSKTVYVSTPEYSALKYVNPWSMISTFMKYRELIISITMQNFRSAYQASYLGVAWQVVLPIIMLTLFYYVFGVIMGGKFVQTAVESPMDYALALFVGLGMYNFVAQNIGSATSLISANQVYVKTLSFPLEIISLTTVLNALLTLLINILLASIILLVTKHTLYPSALCTFFYVTCLFMIALGISWALSAIAIFLRDISAIVSPLLLILMFMCPIFYPASLVPRKLHWVIIINPLALIIEDARGALLYGRWPALHSVVYVLIVSLVMALLGYVVFMRSKNIFADLI